MKQLRMVHHMNERRDNLLIAAARKQKGLPSVRDRPRLRPPRGINSFESTRRAVRWFNNKKKQTPELVRARKLFNGAMWECNERAVPWKWRKRRRYWIEADHHSHDIRHWERQATDKRCRLCYEECLRASGFHCPFNSTR